MATIVTRTGKGSALTFTEADNNFTNLNNDGIANSNSISALQTDKLDKAGGTVTGNLSVSGNVTLGAKLAGSIGNNSQSGANVTLTATTTEIIRLTNSGLVSVAGIDSPSSGQKVVLVNKTGVNISVANDSSSALSANRIFTGNGSDVTLLPNASLSIIYDGSSSKWNVVGGTGSGGGSAGINYIINTDASSGTVGWTTYADAAGAQPVDGSGGSPQPGLWVASSTTPLRGSADFNLVKDNSDRQGNGVAYDFTIDNADLARVLTVSFDYEVLSGTYATGDLTVYLIQDPTGTPVVIQPAGYQVVSATAGTKMTQIATFQTDVAQKSYRLCFHVATTSASAYTLALDNIVLGPTQKVYGAPVADWVSYTPTIGSLTGSVTNATATARYRRIGDSIEGEATITFSGASAAFTSPNITLPSGLFGDTSKIPDTDTDRGIGICSCLDSGTTVYGPWVVGYNSITNKILSTYVPIVNATSASTTEPVKGTNIANNFPFTFGNGDKIFISWKLPILGWSSNVEVSSSTDTRVVAATISRSTSQSIPVITDTKIQFDVVGNDTHGAFSTANNRYICPVPGYYRFSGTFLFASSTSVYNARAGLNKNGSQIAIQWAMKSGTSSAGHTVPFSFLVLANAGDYFEITAYQGSVGSISLLGNDNGPAPGCSVLNVERLSGPSQIAASETVSVGATNTSGQSIPNNSPTIVTNWTKDFDTHGAFNSTTGVFTAPIPGKYRITASIIYQTSGVAGDWRIDVYKNGTIQRGNLINGTLTTFANPIVSLTSNLLAGDTIDVRANQVSTASRTLNSAASYNFLYIERVGN